MLNINNSNNRWSVSNLLLALLGLYSVWQMGVIFFCGSTLSLFGKTPITIDDNFTLIALVCGYVFTIILNYFWYNKSMLLGKIAIIVSAIATFFMFMPMPADVLSFLFYINAFCCTFLIGTNSVIETALFDNKTELKYVFIASFIAFAIIAVLQGDMFTLPFFVFNIISFIILIALSVVYFLLPNNIEKIKKPTTAKKQLPKILYIGSFLAILVSTICLVFGSAVAETVKYGTGLFYISGAAAAIFFGYLVFKKQLSPYKVYTYSFALCIVGFLFIALSSVFNWSTYLGIVLVGVSALPANMIGFLTNSLFNLNPSKIYAPALVFIGFIVAIIQTTLLTLLRNNLQVLLSILALVAVIMLIIFILIEANLTYNWQKISDEFKISNAKNSSLEKLTEREIEIVNYILQGYSNTEIGKLVYLSANTVKSYRKNIYSKLNIHDRKDLFSLVNKNN